MCVEESVTTLGYAVKRELGLGSLGELPARPFIGDADLIKEDFSRICSRYLPAILFPLFMTPGLLIKLYSIYTNCEPKHKLPPSSKFLESGVVGRSQTPSVL